MNKIVINFKTSIAVYRPVWRWWHVIYWRKLINSKNDSNGMWKHNWSLYSRGQKYLCDATPAATRHNPHVWPHCGLSGRGAAAGKKQRDAYLERHELAPRAAPVTLAESLTRFDAQLNCSGDRMLRRPDMDLLLPFWQQEAEPSFISRCFIGAPLLSPPPGGGRGACRR